MNKREGSPGNKVDKQEKVGKRVKTEETCVYRTSADEG